MQKLFPGGFTSRNLLWVLLGERLESAWQALGAALILGTLFWYLWSQRE